MPKRGLNLYDNLYASEDIQEEYMDLTYEDYMDNPKTKEIIINQHFFDFEEHFGEKLKTIYRKHAYLKSDDTYLKDQDMLNDNSFMMFVYDNILKKYNNDFIQNNEILQNIILKDIDFAQEKIQKTKIKINLNTNFKKFDWATKTYK